MKKGARSNLFRPSGYYVTQVGPISKAVLITGNMFHVIQSMMGSCNFGDGVLEGCRIDGVGAFTTEVPSASSECANHKVICQAKCEM